MINVSDVQEQVEMNKREEILEKHPYDIWKGKDGNWHTYLPDKEKGRIPKKARVNPRLSKKLYKIAFRINSDCKGGSNQ